MDRQHRQSELLGAPEARLAFDAFYGYTREHFGAKPPKRLYQDNRYWPVFLQMGKVCVANGWDVVDFVNLSFPKVGKTSRYITPRDVLKQAYCYNRRNVHEEWFGLQKELMAYEANGLSEDDALMSPFLPLPAWFRCLYPENVSMELLRRWGDRAMQEINSSTNVMAFAKTVAPKNLDKLRRLYDSH